MKQEGDEKRTKVLFLILHMGQTQHGNCCWFETVTIPSNENGLVDLEDLKRSGRSRYGWPYADKSEYAWLFEEEIMEIAEIVHDAGGILVL